MRLKFSDWTKIYQGYTIVSKGGHKYTCYGDGAKILIEKFRYVDDHHRDGTLITRSHDLKKMLSIFDEYKIKYIVVEKEEVTMVNSQDDEEPEIDINKEIIKLKENQRIDISDEMVRFIDSLLECVNPYTGEKYLSDNIVYDDKFIKIFEHYRKSITKKQKTKVF